MYSLYSYMYSLYSLDFLLLTEYKRGKESTREYKEGILRVFLVHIEVLTSSIDSHGEKGIFPRHFMKIDNLFTKPPKEYSI